MSQPAKIETDARFVEYDHERKIRFRNKTYRFLVNGQTGEVAGESPLSWFKVTWLVVAVIVFLLVVVVLGSRG